MGCTGGVMSESKKRLIDELIEISRKLHEQSLGMVDQAAAMIPEMKMLQKQMPPFEEKKMRKEYAKKSEQELEQLKSMLAMSGQALEGLSGMTGAAQEMMKQ